MAMDIYLYLYKDIYLFSVTLFCFTLSLFPSLHLSQTFSWESWLKKFQDMWLVSLNRKSGGGCTLFTRGLTI